MNKNKMLINYLVEDLSKQKAIAQQNEAFAKDYMKLGEDYNQLSEAYTTSLINYNVKVSELDAARSEVTKWQDSRNRCFKVAVAYRNQRDEARSQLVAAREEHRLCWKEKAELETVKDTAFRNIQYGHEREANLKAELTEAQNLATRFKAQYEEYHSEWNNAITLANCYRDTAEINEQRCAELVHELELNNSKLEEVNKELVTMSVDRDRLEELYGIWHQRADERLREIEALKAQIADDEKNAKVLQRNREVAFHNQNALLEWAMDIDVQSKAIRKQLVNMIVNRDYSESWTPVFNSNYSEHEGYYECDCGREATYAGSDDNYGDNIILACDDHR